MQWLNTELAFPMWQANPDLIHKVFLYDEASRRGGGVYLWKRVKGTLRNNAITKGYGRACLSLFLIAHLTQAEHGSDAPDAGVRRTSGRMS
jgi:hypothetical protein